MADQTLDQQIERAQELVTRMRDTHGWGHALVVKAERKLDSLRAAGAEAQDEARTERFLTGG